MKEIRAVGNPPGFPDGTPLRTSAQYEVELSTSDDTATNDAVSQWVTGYPRAAGPWLIEWQLSPVLIKADSRSRCDTLSELG
jgi:hypothetical protein